MNLREIKEIMIKYGKSWEKQDIDLILDCFLPNGIYQESPLSKPYKGHKEIARFWKNIVQNKTEKIKFKLGKCYLAEDKKTGFAEWECSCTHKYKEKWIKEKMAGIMILKIQKGKISYLNEYWTKKSEGKVSGGKIIYQ